MAKMILNKELWWSVDSIWVKRLIFFLYENTVLEDCTLQVETNGSSDKKKSIYSARRDEKAATKRHNYLPKFSGWFLLNFFFLFKTVIGIRQHFGLMAWKNHYEIILNYSGKRQGLKTIAFAPSPLELLWFLFIVDISQIWSINVELWTCFSLWISIWAIDFRSAAFPSKRKEKQ